jgi:mono/diheme cytochrome c family protein
MGCANRPIRGAIHQPRDAAKGLTMLKFSKPMLKLHGERTTALHRRLLGGTALASALLLAGCAVEVQNRTAALEFEQLSRPPGSVYTGWRVFQDKCAACHGPAATGAAGGPDLLPRVRTMGSRQFVSLVLTRYDWGLAAAQAGSEGAAREALIDDVVQQKAGMLTMPAWQGEPRVSAHIVDLYAYVSARAQGTQGPDRPAP